MENSKEKQIEEMARDLCNIDCKGMKCNVCDAYGCEYRMQAEALYNAGYRKSTEVAEEIFGEIFALCDNAEEKLDILFTKVNDYRKGYENSVKHFKDNMSRLKKKYTEVGK